MNMNHGMETRGGRFSGGASGGAVLIVLGSLLLADRLGYIGFGDVIRFWPVVLVAVGAVKIGWGRHSSERFFGVVLAAAGSMLLLDKLGIINLNFRLVLPVLLIGLGISLLWKTWSSKDDGVETGAEPRLNHWTVFGGFKCRNTSADFRGGSVFVLFGESKVDLTGAGTRGGAVLDVTAIFGAVELRVPEDWTIALQGAPVFGAFEDKTYRPKPSAEGPRKALTLKGVVVFGGVEVKN
jgi:predicted membrane protein